MASHAAARKTDPHSCPQIDKEVIVRSCWWNGEKLTPHVGGAILEGSADVNVNGLPAARCTDSASCDGVGAAPMIVTGPAKVKINGKVAAVVTSRVVHTGAVTAGSPNVFYGGDVVGITLGDHEASTKACKQAAEKRRKTDVDGGTKSSQEQQSYPKNCGPETVRQMCIEECNRHPSNTKACEACNTSEADWYARFVRDKKIQQLNNDNQAVESKVRSDENQAAADELGKGETIEKKDGKGRWKEVTAPDNWLQKEKDSKLNNQHAGRYRITYPDGTQKEVTIQHEHSPRDIPAEPEKNQFIVDQGTVGSFPAQRAYMLKEWCGFKDVTEGENTENGIAKDLAEDKQVNAVVDIAKLPGNENYPGSEAHVVQVTGMIYDDEGNLKDVYINDTSYGGSCGRHLTGEEFDKALMANRKTDVATRPAK